ncbi:MAG: hypothetical protein KBH81_06230 [Phycisphaerae bacterium]|mgnify:FL=1|jgi:hypothetical protein|nr:hypothetical protein [Phycisphaerae bacterium]HRS29646.1 hypothetical protein [Phycisphaerae bacterium]
MESMRNRLKGWNGGTKLTQVIEEQTSRLPSDTFLWAAGAAIVTSLVLQIMNRREHAQFVGQWAPTFLALGLYSKLVRHFGHE